MLTDRIDQKVTQEQKHRSVAAAHVKRRHEGQKDVIQGEEKQLGGDDNKNS